MFGMSEREKEKAKLKSQLRGIDDLAEMGGFIRESIEDTMYLLYSDEVLEQTEKYISLGPGFMNVADAVDLAYQASAKYDTLCFSGFESDFETWLMEHVARLEAEKIKKDEGSFWMKWGFSRKTRQELMKLNSLDERVLLLSAGVASGKKMNPVQISELPEFDCDPSYINAVLNSVEETLNCDFSVNKEFHQACEAHRSR